MPGLPAVALVFTQECKIVVFWNDVRLIFRGLLRLRSQDFVKDMLANEGRPFLLQHCGLEGIWPSENSADFQSGIQLESRIRRVKPASCLILTQGIVLPLTVCHHPRKNLGD